MFNGYLLISRQHCAKCSEYSTILKKRPISMEGIVGTPKAFQAPEHEIAIAGESKHIPLHALEFRTRITEGGIVDDPSVSAS